MAGLARRLRCLLARARACRGPCPLGDGRCADEAVSERTRSGGADMTITATAVRAAKALSRTTSLCIACKEGIPAEIVELEGRIIMRKRCPRHGPQEIMLSSDAAWYHRT